MIESTFSVLEESILKSYSMILDTYEMAHSARMKIKLLHESVSKGDLDELRCVLKELDKLCKKCYGTSKKEA